MPLSWYIIRTNPRAENQAAAELTSAGNQIFFPRFKSALASYDKQEIPIFPGYLFINCDLEGMNPPNLEHAPHVTGWVQFERVVPVVPDDVIKALADRIEALNNRTGPWIQYRAGQMVRVESKVMETVATVVEDVTSGKKYVKVLLEFMDRQVMAQVPWENLRATDSSDECFHKSVSGFEHPYGFETAHSKVVAPRGGRALRRTRGHGRRTNLPSVNGQGEDRSGTTKYTVSAGNRPKRLG